MGAANTALNQGNQIGMGPVGAPQGRMPMQAPVTEGVIVAGVGGAPKKKRSKKLPPQVEKSPSKDPQQGVNKPPKNPMDVMLGTEVGKPGSPYRK